MQVQPIKLGIIGCGIAARDLHWPALKKLKQRFQITLVCNHTEPKARAFSEMVGGVPFVLDYRDLLTSPEVEAVDIILPIHLNFQVTRDALQAGKHVLVEKPLAANLQDAQKMAVFEGQFSQVMMVAENFRYHDVFYRVKSYLEAGEIGTPYAVFWDIFYLIDEHKNKYAQTQWRIHHQYPGAFITDAGIHNIAALRLLFGDLKTGGVFTTSVNPNIGEIDGMSLQFAAEKDVHGVLNIFVSARGVAQNRLLILGTRGSLAVEDIQRIQVSRDSEIVHSEIIETDNGYYQEFEAFSRAIRHDEKVVSTFAEAYRDLEVIIGALNSANSDRTRQAK